MTTPTIPAGNLFMNATLYTGDGAASKVITNGVAGQAFQPDLVWIKDRSVARNNDLMDSIRGAGNGLFSNLTNAEVASGYLTSFNSNGFTTGNDVSTNGSGETFVAWQWKAGGTAVTNTSGTISAQVSANTTSGFSVVTYTGTGANATVGHGLGVAPSMIIIKVRSRAADDWGVYHASLGNTGFLSLNTTAANTSSSVFWNSTSPTSSVFSLGTNSNVNPSGQTLVAYCWSEIAGFSKFGSYTGNGSADGPFIYTGFRPRFLMVKSSTYSGSEWNIVDASRSPDNGVSLRIYADSSAAEDSTGGSPYVDFVSNGFKIRTTNTDWNRSTDTYIYMAFAENPFKYSLAR
jgi:hypothetical protein